MGDDSGPLSRRHRGWLILTPPSDTIDYDSAPDFRAQALAAVERGDRKLAVDLSNVRLIDSMGLGAFVAIRKRLGEQGLLRIFGASPQVRSFLALVRMNDLLPHYETEWEATWD